ncbi:hypothetical protein ABMC88_06490 [Sulfitobacter sp. HNIBRBA2951]|uniref:hypothetical protein n=1 Tax=Sulfitobacter aquimarinus TaxID=3158557 RepID=UPI0032E03145
MRSYYRKKLNRLIGAAGKEEFIQLLWATHILQSDNPEPARKFIQSDTIPKGAETVEMWDELSIRPWEIETLANELMTVRKKKTTRNGRTRTLHWDHFQAAAQCVNWLRHLENAEFSIQKERQDVFFEMGRIAARQFDWQRGYVNVPQFYRNVYVYGQGECAAYFERTHGISLDRFVHIGFMLYVLLTQYPVIRNNDVWGQMGIKPYEVERVLSLVALPYPQAAKQARENRRGVIHTADKPSILRQSPCLRFGEEGERIRAPLPDLILERVTSGVFYDVVGGGGPIRDDYGKRFEDYCFNYLTTSLPNSKWTREFDYRKKPNSYASPDILCFLEGEIDIAIECKATKMSHQAMFGRDPIAARGYEDMTKAVFQIWRFFSHCRRGFSGLSVTPDAVGVVLTLDNWLEMSEPLRRLVFKGAEEMACKKEPLITEEDRRPIPFVAAPELERTLTVVSEASFKEALISSNTTEFLGWRLDTIAHKLPVEADKDKRRYPFADDLGRLLPWWEDRGRKPPTF